ncbi:CYTH domain-containing protein [Pectobacterium aroidearum]|uniref:CYTH domain-containing protein n=1 Tax=Pectobacterium aroidearum TaxID=1201031 RepID=UPI003159347C
MVEIERKFLIASDEWRERVVDQIRIRQGYLTSDNTVNSIRVRTVGKEAWITIKSVGYLKRQEFEYKIPFEEGQQMLDDLCPGYITEKIRYRVLEKEIMYEVNIFEGVNAGLSMVEVELSREDEIIQIPSWVGQEVTHDSRYYGAFIGDNPYTLWMVEKC